MTTDENPEWRQVGGGRNDVWTDGEYVRRPARPWSDALRQLLEHLEVCELTGVPRFVRLEENYEVLTYLRGTVATRPRPEPLQSTEWLREVGDWMGAFHEATREFELDDGSMFAWGPEESAPGQVVTHGDLGPWNMLVDHGAFAGVIDWEFARFGDPLDDLAEAACELAPLRENREMLADEPAIDDIVGRIDALCRGYGEVEWREVVDHVEPMFRERLGEAEGLAEAGREPFASAAEVGAMEGRRRDLEYFRTHWAVRLQSL